MPPVTNGESKASDLGLASERPVHQSRYPEYLPIANTNPFPLAEPFEHHDRGHNADPSKPNLLKNDSPNIKVTRLTPHFGTEISGIQFSQLNDAGKDELALLVAERGIVVFRDQDFKDIGKEKQKEFGQYFGPLHIHPVFEYIKDYPELHPIYLGPDNIYRLKRTSTRLSATWYHSDVSYEHQPPALTFLTVLHVPECGGDTAWASQALAYERLSDHMKQFLEGLKAEHGENARTTKGARPPLASFHPVVRVHPVTGEKVLFVNQGFTKRIVGLKDEESDAILQLLFKHIERSQDIQARVKWKEGTVVFWDNRITCHTAIPDYDVHEEGIRQAFRITTLGEKPVGVNGLESSWD